MSKTLQWIIGIGVVLIVISIIVSTILPFFIPRAAWNSGFGYGMMGPGHMPFFGIGMWLWPLLFIGLVVLGVVWLVRAVALPGVLQPSIATMACPHCGKPIQIGWKACPYCGEKI